MARKKRFQGTGTALVTPFAKDGSLDETALRRLVDCQIKGGVEALIPVGTTGESPTLSDKEKRRVFDIVIEQAKGKAVVIAGTGINSTSETIDMTRQAKAAGADMVLIVGPYYNKPSQEGYFQHYRAIADAVDIPFIIYNVPGRTGGNIEAPTILRIAEEIPTAAGVKEASANMAQIMEIAKNKPERFSLLSGDDYLAYPMIALGGDGIISVVSNQVPKLFSTMVRLALKGNFKKALEIHNKLLPLMQYNFVEANPIPVKSSMAMVGLMEDVFRLPLVPLNQKYREKMKVLLKELKLMKE